MVADVHRTLKYGGIFMYPATGNLKYVHCTLNMYRVREVF